LDVYPDGKQILMLDNIQRLKFRKGFEKAEPATPNSVEEVQINLSSISLILNRGHRIGVQISSANYPRFEKNPNTGEDFPGEETRIAHNSIYMDLNHPSALLLPVRP
jgi:putative CocE/NonD family hydrolase